MNSTSFFNSKNMPQIRSRVLNSEILPIIGTYNFHKEAYSRILIMLSGSAEYKLISPDRQPIESPLVTNHLFVLDSSDSLVLKSDTQCQILVISFELFEIVDFADDLYNSNQIVAKYQELHLLSECISVAETESRYPCFKSDLANLILHCRLSPIDLVTLPYSLESVISTLIRVQFSSLINILNSINAVAFTVSGSFSAPLTIRVSDVKLLTKSPTENTDSECLFIAYAENSRVEIPNNNAESKLDFFVCKNHPTQYAEFNQLSRDTFKFWLYPKDDAASPALNRSMGYICFSFQANQPGTFQLSLTQLPTYQSIDYFFEITQPDTWTDIIIPVFKTSAVNPITPYVEKALQYIQENYTEKITIQDIADNVRIHPSYLSAIFRKNLNQSVNGYINSYRVDIAKRLLRNSTTSITDIALLTGFYDAQHFLKTFKKLTGHTPTQYRNTK